MTTMTDLLVTIAPPEPIAPAVGETQPLVMPEITPAPLAPPAEGATQPLVMPPPVAALPRREQALLVLAAASSLLAMALAISLVLALGDRAAREDARAAIAKLGPTPPISVIVPTALIRPDLPPGEYQAYPVGALPVALIAYDRPDGASLGAVEVGRPYSVIAQAEGGAWIQLAIFGGGNVWVRAADIGGAPLVRRAELRDLTPPTPQPTPAAAPPLVAAATGAATPPPAGASPLQPVPSPTPNADGLIVVEDSPGRYEAIMPPPPGSTPTPDGGGWGGEMHGGGGSWGP